MTMTEGLLRARMVDACLAMRQNIARSVYEPNALLDRLQRDMPEPRVPWHVSARIRLGNWLIRLGEHLGGDSDRWDA